MERMPLTDAISVDEVYLLKKYRWLLLSNQGNIEYRLEPKYDKHFKYFINTFGYEEKFLALHPYIKDFRDLKEEYVRFNSRNTGNPLNAATEIDSLINTAVVNIRYLLSLGIYYINTEIQLLTHL